MLLLENFEDWALKGGGAYLDRYGNEMRALEGMAHWTPIIDGQICEKGGVGTYHMGI